MTPSRREITRWSAVRHPITVEPNVSRRSQVATSESPFSGLTSSNLGALTVVAAGTALGDTRKGKETSFLPMNHRGRKRVATGDGSLFVSEKSVHLLCGGRGRHNMPCIIITVIAREAVRLPIRSWSEYWIVDYVTSGRFLSHVATEFLMENQFNPFSSGSLVYRSISCTRKLRWIDLFLLTVSLPRNDSVRVVSSCNEIAA